MYCLYYITTETELENIIRGCINADRECQKRFYQLYYGFSMSICMRYCPASHEAMEVVNDGFMKIFKQLPLFQPRYSNYEASMKGWIKTIMVNTSIDHFRKNSKNYFVAELEESHAEMTSGGETAIDKMTYNEILAIVQQLSPVYKAVFNLFVIDGFTHEEIGVKLNISTGTSKSNLSKAKANIQKMLKEATSYHEQKAV